MAADLNILARMNLGTDATVIHSSVTSFPVTPSDGELAFKSGILYIYATIDAVTTWFPLTNKKYTYVHQQAIAAASWVVEHNFNTDEFGYFVYDANHDLILAEHTIVNSNSFTIDLSEATTGMVVVVFNVDDVGGGSIGSTVGDMVSGNTESGIDVTYDSNSQKLNFNVDDPTITLDGAVTGSNTMTNLGNVTITTDSTTLLKQMVAMN
jgi:hypothetical protein